MVLEGSDGIGIGIEIEVAIESRLFIDRIQFSFGGLLCTKRRS